MKYEIWMTQGQGQVCVALAKDLEEALAYVKQYEGEGSFGIKGPDGWYEWPSEREVES